MGRPKDDVGGESQHLAVGGAAISLRWESIAARLQDGLRGEEKTPQD